jgi:predicted permease
VLLVCAGLFAGTLRNLRNIDPGFNREHVLLVNAAPGEHGYKGRRLRGFFESLADRARSHPGVMSASLSLITPLSGASRTTTVHVEGYQPAKGEEMELDFNNVGRGYFATMGIPMLVGRDFRPEDEPVETVEGGPVGAGVTERGERPRPAAVARRVAIVNESFVRHFLAGGSPIGRRLSYYGSDASFEIVGVVRDVHYRSLTRRTPYMIYVPSWTEGAEWRMLAVRTADEPKALISAIRADLRALDPGIPMHEAITLADQVDATLTSERLMAHISTAFAIIALLLAAVGLYGVLAQNVARRTKEIGIRMALGADRRRILRMVLWQTGTLAVAGILLGAAGAAAAARLVAKMLYGVQPLDLRAFAAAAALLLAVALGAAWLPARRAASVDPTDALHYE